MGGRQGFLPFTPPPDPDPGNLPRVPNNRFHGESE